MLKTGEDRLISGIKKPKQLFEGVELAIGRHHINRPFHLNSNLQQLRLSPQYIPQYNLQDRKQFHCW